MRIWVAALAATLSVNVFAQDGLIGTIPRNNGSVLEVMKANKCQEGWLSQILLDSRIKPSEYRRQPQGKRIVLLGNSCQNVPPLAVREQTRLILRGPRVVERVVEKPAPPDPHVSQIADFATKESNWKSLVATLERQRDEALERVKELTREPVVRSPSRTFWWAVVVALALGFLVAYLLGQRRLKGKVLLDERKSVWNFGERHFDLITMEPSPNSKKGFVGLYNCSLCTKGPFREDEVEKMKEHIRTSHRQASAPASI